MSNNQFPKSPSFEEREAQRVEKHRERERDNSAKIDLLEQKVVYSFDGLAAQLDHLQKSVDNIDKKTDTIEEDIKGILQHRIPTIEQQLTELKTKASMYGGLGGVIFGSIMSIVVSVILHFMGVSS